MFVLLLLLLIMFNCCHNQMMTFILKFLGQHSPEVFLVTPLAHAFHGPRGSALVSKRGECFTEMAATAS